MTASVRKAPESTNTAPAPIVVRSAPPINGPAMREPCRVIPESATALSRCSLGTTLGMIACSAGVPNARPRPPMTANTSTCQASTSPANVMAASATAAKMPTASATMAIMRRSARSASAPPMGPKMVIWIMPANVTAPTHAPCPVSSNTSHPRASSMVQNDADAKKAFQKTCRKSEYSSAGWRSVMAVSIRVVYPGPYVDVRVAARSRIARARSS